MANDIYKNLTGSGTNKNTESTRRTQV